MVVGGKKPKLCAPTAKQLLKLATTTCGGECRWSSRPGFICNPRLHDLAQRVVGRDLIELKRSRALRTYGRGLKAVPDDRTLVCSVAARASPPG